MTDKTIYESDAKGEPRPLREAVRGATPRQAIPPAGERLKRRRRRDDFMNFKGLEPPGFTYEWKRKSLFGQPHTAHMIEMREQHWKPVPASRHPDRAVAGETTIERDGSILMERPTYLVEEARMEEIQDAMAPVRQMEDIMYGTPANTMTRDHPTVRNSSFVRRQYSPGPPVEDEGGLEP